MDTQQSADPDKTEPTHILVVDDNPSDCYFVSSEVRRLVPGAQIERISTENEYRRALERERADICVIDYHLGWDNGIHAAQILRNQWPECRVIMMTGSANDREIAVRARAEKYLDDFIRKDEGPHRIEFALKAAFERRLTAELLRAHELKHGALAELMAAGCARTNRDAFLQQAVELIARTTGAARCRVLEVAPDQRSPKVIADTAADTNADGCADLQTLALPEMMAATRQHQHVAAISVTAAAPLSYVTIAGASGPFGLLVVNNSEHGAMDSGAGYFLEAAAGIIGLVANSNAPRAQRDAGPREAFLCNIAHEIRTPLNGITGACELVMEMLSGVEQATLVPITRLIDKNCARLAAAVDALVEMSVVEKGLYQPCADNVELSVLVAGLITRKLARAQAKGLSLTFINRQSNVIVRADRNSLEKACLAILDNAVKFTDKTVDDRKGFCYARWSS